MKYSQMTEKLEIATLRVRWISDTAATVCVLIVLEVLVAVVQSI